MARPTPRPAPCICSGLFLCHRHEAAFRELRSLARNITVPDDVWLNALHKTLPDDLHRLLGAA